MDAKISLEEKKKKVSKISSDKVFHLQIFTKIWMDASVL